MNIKKDSRPSLANRYFSLLSRRKISDRLLLQLSLVAFLATALYSTISISTQNVTSLPGSGGILMEGIIGTPRFVNPVLATTRADRDMVELIYSGLMELDEDGNLRSDLAESVTLSEDGQTYHVKIRNDAYFHDGSRVLAKDVAYTIALIQNPDLKSPLRGSWDGVLVEELGEKELNIVIAEPYAPFIENLVVGILPRDTWADLPTEQLPFSQNNTNPIGSGVYQIEDVIYNKSGLIDSYKLVASTNYQDNANIEKLQVKFYPDEKELFTALQEGDITSTANLSEEQITRLNHKNFSVSEHTLPRTFTIYFNQNKSPVLRDKSVRRALDTAIDKERLVNEVLAGHGQVSNSPIPQGFITPTTTEEVENDYDPITKARGILTDGGWTQNEEGKWIKESDDGEMELTISLSTANTPLFDKTATYIAETWTELGVEVRTAQFEQTDLVQAIIRPRDFQALLFGVDLTRAVDLYPFWHSSQKSDPGLNVAQYTNIDVDALLEDNRTNHDESARENTNQAAISIIQKDTPAIFLFSPNFSYVHHTDLSLNIYPQLSNQSERFVGIEKWYIKAEKLWPIFNKINY